MKYQNIKAFEKHLASAAPHNLCRAYLIAIGDDLERKKALHSLAKILVPPGDSEQRYSGSDAEVRHVTDALQSPNLFGGEPVVVVDECEKWGKKEAEALSDFLERGAFSGYLLLGARGKTPLSKAVEKIGVVLDLSEEKPWDKEKRLAEGLNERAKLHGKRLASDAAPLLFERIGSDPAVLECELDKLICYVGDRPTIERSDIFRIGSASKTHTLWQMAEEMVWENGLPCDASSFHGLVPSLRSQLSLGLKLATLFEAGVPQEEWSRHLPKMWPRALEKRREQAIKKGASYFRKGLDLLFKIELLSRTGSGQEEALLDLFRTSMSSYARR